MDPGILLAALVILAASFGGKGIACWAAARASGESKRDAMYLPSAVGSCNGGCRFGLACMPVWRYIVEP